MLCYTIGGFNLVRDTKKARYDISMSFLCDVSLPVSCGKAFCLEEYIYEKSVLS